MQLGEDAHTFKKIKYLLGFTDYNCIFFSLIMLVFLKLIPIYSIIKVVVKLQGL